MWKLKIHIKISSKPYQQNGSSVLTLKLLANGHRQGALLTWHIGLGCQVPSIFSPYLLQRTANIPYHLPPNLGYIFSREYPHYIIHPLWLPHLWAFWLQYLFFLFPLSLYVTTYGNWFNLHSPRYTYLWLWLLFYLQ